jgi:hypothetical protein
MEWQWGVEVLSGSWDLGTSVASKEEEAMQA